MERGAHIFLLGMVIGCSGAGPSSEIQTIVSVGGTTSVDMPTTSTTGRAAIQPAVATDGTDFLVVWSDARVNNGSETDIWGTRVAADGTVLDPIGIKIFGGPGNQANPTVAFDGTQYLIAWEDDSTADLGVAMVAPDGTVASVASPATTPSNEVTPVAVGNAVGAMLVWVADGQVVGATFDGSTFGPPMVVAPSANTQTEPGAAVNPNGDYLVVFSESLNGVPAIRGRLVTPTGAFSSNVIDISISGSPNKTPNAAFDGTNFLVLWSGYYGGVDIFGTRVTTAGSILDTHVEGSDFVGGKLVDKANNYQEAPSIACRASECYASWQDKRHLAVSGYEVYGRVLDHDLSLPTSDFLVSSAPLNQLGVRVAATNAGYFQVWQDARSGGNAAIRIAGTRVTPSGGVLDPTGIVVTPGNNSQFAPTVAAHADVFAVAWNDSRSLWGDDILALRLDADNHALDSTPVSISDAEYTQTQSSMVGFGDGFLTAWSDNRSGNGTDVFVARSNAATGAVIDPLGIQVSFGNGNNVTPQLAASNGDALIVWGNAPSATERDVYGAIIDAAGVPGAPFVISAGPGEQGRPAVSYDPIIDQYVVVWQDTRTGLTDIYATRVSHAGDVLDPMGVPVAAALTGNRLNPRIASNGNGATVVYQDDRAGNWDIYATRVSGNLTVLDPTGIAVTTDLATQAGPAISALGSSYVVVWGDSRGTTGDIWGQVLAADGSLVDASFIASGEDVDEGSPALAATSTNHVLLGYRVQRHDLEASRVMTRWLDLPDQNETPCSIEVMPSHLTIHVGQTQAFTAIAHFADASLQDVTTQVTWSSSLTGVASVTGAGVAYGASVGTTQIVATLGTVQGSGTLTVVQGGGDCDYSREKWKYHHKH